jgi:TPR repeat protein
MEWYEFAAEGGLPAAQNNLGQLLLHGVIDGTATKAAAAVQLFQAAADQGSPAALFNLGMCHELGLCGKGPDAAAAAECYQLAGSEKALLRLGHLHLQQRSKAAAREAFAAAAEAGSAEALLQLAKIEAAGCSHEQHTLQSTSFGLAGLCGAAGSLSAGGTNSSLAVSSSSKGYTSSAGSSIILAASSSLNSSCSSLAASARSDAALTLFQKAAAAGIAEAQHTVGCVCWGKGMVADAMQSWHAAAGQGYGPALLCLAAAAEKGLQGVRKDCAAARACYAMAAACGCEEGAAQLVLLDQEAVLQNSLWHCLGSSA